MYKRRKILFSGLILSVLLTSCEPTKNSDKWLKDVYKNYFAVGAAFNEIAANGMYDDLVTHYNSFTAENEMKWSSVHPKDDVFDFTAADKMVQYAKSHKMDIRGHALVWHEAIPEEVFYATENVFNTKTAMLEIMENHIRTVMAHFGDDVRWWDVVNEAIDDSLMPLNSTQTNIYRQSNWYQICGEDFILEAFKIAGTVRDELGLNVKLYYNDYSLATPVKREKTIAMLEWLIAEGAPLDGIGMQSHYHIGSFDVDEFERTIIAYSELGLDVQITEFDVNVYDESSASASDARTWYNVSLPAEIEAIQTTIYDRAFNVMRKHKDKISNVTFWGVADDMTYMDRIPYIGRKNYPYIFDMFHEKKTSFYAITDWVE